MMKFEYRSDVFLLWIVAAGSGAAGVILICFYSFATPGLSLRYVGVGLLTALAALAAGSLVGFLFGIPKIVSTGEFRLRSQASGFTCNDPCSPETPGAADDSNARGANSNGDKNSHFTPSTNLSEVSDWLTKLLLGAGLVQLTSLGAPLGALIDTIASGMEGSGEGGSPSGSATVVAGATLIAYFVLGFLSGYVTTTLWYGHRIREV